VSLSNFQEAVKLAVGSTRYKYPGRRVEGESVMFNPGDVRVKEWVEEGGKEEASKEDT